MATVIISAPLPGEALAVLRQAGHRLVVGDSPYGLGRDGLMEALHGAPETEALITLLSDQVDRCLLNAGPELRVIANYAVGVDNLDLPELQRREVVVTNTPGVLTEASADLAFALMLDAARNVSAGDRLVRAGAWQGWSPTLLVGVCVHGATLGIVGCGRIGQAVARRAAGFGMRILYHQRRPLPPERERELGASYVSLEQLLAQSDFVTLHCPLTAETRGLLSRERMTSMKRGAVLVNTARGACVDEQALAQLLASGHLFAAGLDVYANEPCVDDGLLAVPNVVLAPHLGSADAPTRARMASMCVESIIAVLEGREPEHRVR